MPSPSILYRYNPQVKVVLRDLKHAYDGLVLNAHLLAYYGNAILSFLQTAQMPFFIDPMTYIFGVDVSNLLEEGEFRTSYGELAASYGKPFSGCETQGALSPKTLANDDKRLNEMAEKVLKFQQDICLGHKFDKYRRYLKTVSAAELCPDFLVAPYFHFNAVNDPWYAVTLDVAKRSQTAKCRGGYDLYAAICASNEVIIDPESIQRIASDYAGFDGCLIWVPRFREQDASKEYLVGLKSLVKALSKNGRPILGLSGSYFSALLSKWGLRGFVAGVCYGEAKPLEVPEHGWRPDPRYYVWQIHRKVPPTSANLVFSEGNNIRLLCECEICKHVRERVNVTASRRSDYVREFFTKMKEDEYRRHFVMIRNDEIIQIRKENESQVISRLDDEIGRLEATQTFSLRARTGHLKSWKSALEASSI